MTWIGDCLNLGQSSSMTPHGEVTYARGDLMAKRKRTFSATVLTYFVPSWFYKAWGLVAASAAAVAYGLTLGFHVSGFRSMLVVPVAMALFPPLCRVRRRVAEVTLDTSGVQIDGTLRLRPPLVASRAAHPQGERSIHVEGNGGHVRLIDVAEDLVEPILRATNRVKWEVFASNRVGPHARAVLAVPVAMFFVAWFLWRTEPLYRLVFPGALAAAFAMLFAWAFRMQVTLRVGRDGVEMATGGARKFFPIDELAACTVVLESGIAEGLELVLRDGSSEKLIFRSIGSKTTPRREEPARAASAAIEKAIARFSAPGPSPDPR